MVLDPVHFVDAVDVKRSFSEGIGRERVESPPTCHSVPFRTVDVLSTALAL